MQLTSLRMAKGKSVHGSKRQTQINMSIVLPSFLTQSVKLGAMMIACAAFSFSISWCNLDKEFRGPSGSGRDGNLIDIDCSHQRGQMAWGQEQVPLQTGDRMGTVKKQIY